MSKKNIPKKKIQHKTVKIAPKTQNNNFWMTTSIFLSIILLISIINGGLGLDSPSVSSIKSDIEKLEKSTDNPTLKNSLSELSGSLEPFLEVKKEKVLSSGDKVKLDFYVMSQCPYGTQVEDAIYPVLEKIGERVDFNLNFISTDLGSGNFKSLHGEPETKGNIVQLCAAKYEPDKYMDMIVCQNKNARAIPGNWESCAKENTLDVNSIKSCYEGDEGRQLLSVSSKMSADVNAQGSPTIYLNDVMYQGGRTEVDFFTAICNSISSDRPEACSSIPKPLEFKMYVIEDKRCTSCDSSKILSVTSQIFPGAIVEKLDYTTGKGKELYDAMGVVLMPMYVMEKTAKDDPGFSKVSGALKLIGDYYVILPAAAGATHDPNAEICTNGVDDNADGIIDCKDPKCAPSLECRDEKNQQIDLFIMSDCPYGRKAVEGLKEAVDNFGTELKFDIHYIASEQGDGFKSLHGQYEWEENVRQLCAKDIDSTKYLDYIYCRSINGVRGVDWQSCATSSGFDTTAMQTCFDGKGKDLLREDIKIGNGLSVSASPTWLTNNRFKFSGVDAETIRGNFCQYNPGTPGCENTLSGSSGVPSGAGCGVQ